MYQLLVVDVIDVEDVVLDEDEVEVVVVVIVVVVVVVVVVDVLEASERKLTDISNTGMVHRRTIHLFQILFQIVVDRW